MSYGVVVESTIDMRLGDYIQHPSVGHRDTGLSARLRRLTGASTPDKESRFSKSLPGANPGRLFAAWTTSNPWLALARAPGLHAGRLPPGPLRENRRCSRANRAAALAALGLHGSGDRCAPEP